MERRELIFFYIGQAFLGAFLAFVGGGVVFGGLAVGVGGIQYLIGLGPFLPNDNLPWFWIAGAGIYVRLQTIITAQRGGYDKLRRKPKQT